MNTRSALASTALAVLILTTASTPGHARSMEFTPFVGYFSPQSNQTNNSTAPLVIRQSAATAFGAHATWWATNRLGIELGVLVAESDIRYFANQIVTFDAQIFQADLRVRFRVNDPTGPVGFDLIAGLGIANLDDTLSDIEDDTAGLGSPNKTMGVLGVGATAQVTDRISLRFDVEDRIHGGNIEVSDDLYGESVDGETQHDFVMTMGIVIPVWSK